MMRQLNLEYGGCVYVTRKMRKHEKEAAEAAAAAAAAEAAAARASNPGAEDDDTKKVGPLLVCIDIQVMIPASDRMLQLVGQQTLKLVGSVELAGKP
jgi:hypothetical protein